MINGRAYLYPTWGNGGRWNQNNCIWMIGDDHVARPVARVGGTGFSWQPQINGAFFANVPKDAHVNRMLAAWSDRNGNGKVDSDEWATRQMEGSYVAGDGQTRLIIPREGAWTFVLNSDDGSRLWIGDDLLVDNDGDYNPQDHTGSTRLAKGLHPIRIAYRQGTGGAKLDVGWIRPQITDSPIPAEALFHTPK